MERFHNMDPRKGSAWGRLRVAFWRTAFATPARLAGGAWRLWWGHCPLCNSDAPLLDHCKVCRGSREYPPSPERRTQLWRDYLWIVNLLGSGGGGR